MCGTIQFNSVFALSFTTHRHNVKKKNTHKKGGSGLQDTNIFKKIIYTNLNNKVINNVPVLFCLLLY